jgi:hypothetical protein
MSKTRMCIGGPKDGQTIMTADSQIYLRAAGPSRRTAIAGPGSFDPNTTVPIVDYHLQQWATGPDPLDRMEFWVPQGQTARQTMDMLVKSHEQQARRRF